MIGRTKRNPHPNGTHTQTEPTHKRNPHTNGTHTQTEPTRKRNPHTNGTYTQAEPHSFQVQPKMCSKRSPGKAMRGRYKCKTGLGEHFGDTSPADHLSNGYCLPSHGNVRETYGPRLGKQCGDDLSDHFGDALVEPILGSHPRPICIQSGTVCPVWGTSGKPTGRVWESSAETISAIILGTHF